MKRPLIHIWVVFQVLLIWNPTHSIVPTRLSVAPLGEPVIAEVPVLISATLADSSGIPLPGQTLSFEWMNGGVWENMDDGLTATVDVTRNSGIADTYFVPSRVSFADWRISFAGNDTLGPVDTTLTVAIDPRRAALFRPSMISPTRGVKAYP
jgi:hypothetical protein